MAKFRTVVRVPFTGFLDITVEHDEELSEEDAIAQALEVDFVVSDYLKRGDAELEVVNQIVQGNVFHGLQNEVEIVDHNVEQGDDDEEDEDDAY